MKYVPSNVTESDLPAIYRLASQVSEQFVIPTLSPAGREALRSSLENSTYNILADSSQARKVVLAGQLVAYIAWRDDNYIAQLYVDTVYQGCGIATMLLDDVVRQTKSPILKLRASLNAVGFYEQYGFHRTAEADEINNIAFVPMEYIIP